MTLGLNRNSAVDLSLPRFTVTIHVEGMPDNPWETTRILSSKSLVDFIYFMRNFLIIYTQRVRSRTSIDAQTHIEYCKECRAPYLLDDNGERITP